MCACTGWPKHPADWLDRRPPAPGHPALHRPRPAPGRPQRGPLATGARRLRPAGAGCARLCPAGRPRHRAQRPGQPHPGRAMVLDPDAPARKRRSPQRQATWQALEHWLAAGDTGPLLAQARFGLPLSHLQRLCGQRQPPVPPDLQAHPPAPGRRPAAAPGQLAGPANPVARGPGAISPAAARRTRRAATPACSASSGPARPTPAASTKHCGKPWWPSSAPPINCRPKGPGCACPATACSSPSRKPPWPNNCCRALPQAGSTRPGCVIWPRTPGNERRLVRQLLRKLARQGVLFQVVKDLFYAQEHMNALAALVTELATQNAQGQVIARDFRDATGLGRKRAIQIMRMLQPPGPDPPRGRCPHPAPRCPLAGVKPRKSGPPQPLQSPLCPQHSGH